MEDFDTLMKQAVSIKTGQMLQKRRKFESLPIFTKAGLYYLVKYSNVRNQGFYQCYAISDHLKARGNKLFKEEKVDLAVREYEQALSIFRYIINKNPNWKSEGIIDEDLEYINKEGEDEEEKSMATSIKVALYNNLAACYLSMGDFQSSKAACDEALLLDPTQAKALYRRARALVSDINAGIEEYKAAQEDLKKALELSPDDSVIQQALNKVKHDMVKIKSSSQAFKGIFVDKNKKNTEEDTSQLKRSESIKTIEGSEGREEAKEKETPSQAKPSESGKQSNEKNENIDRRKEKEDEKIAEKDNTLPKKAETPKIQKQDGEKTSEPSNKPLVEQKQQKKEISEAVSSSTSKENPKAGNEIKELEKFLEKRGNELLRVYQASGRTQLAEELKENLRKAMAAKQRLEKITTFDFEKPNDQLKEEAEKFGLDLNDPDIKEELLRIQRQHLQEIRNWISAVDPNTNKVQYTSSLDRPKKKKLKAQEATSTTTPSGDPSSKKKTKEQHEEDPYESVEKLKETKNSKSAKMLNMVIVAAAVLLFVFSMYMQGGRPNANPRQSITKDI